MRFKTLLFLVGIIFLYCKIQSVEYFPPEPPVMEGVFAPNKELLKSKKIILSKGFGAEDVELDPEGNLYTGYDNGNIVRISVKEIQNFLDSPQMEIRIEEEILENTGGRPLGFRYGYDGNLYVADAVKGLLRVNLDPEKNYKIEVLANKSDGIPFKFTDHLDVSRDGKVYFTDASSKYGKDEYLYDLLESKPYGRFLVYDTRTNSVTTLIKDLYFPNGVALSKEEDFVIINETYRYRIIRYWLKGEKQGTYEVFYDNLPGFPDNARSNEKGNFWVCHFTIRNPVMDKLHPHPILKNILSVLPRFLWPKPARYGLIAEINPQGKFIRSLQDPVSEESKFVIITGVKEFNNRLYFSSLYGNWIGIYPLF